MHVGRKIIDELSQPFRAGREDLEISCSIGVSVYPEDGTDVHSLMVNADRAMYSAKKSGRRRVRFHNQALLPDGA